jgi:hypothetical protein
MDIMALQNIPTPYSPQLVLITWQMQQFENIQQLLKLYFFFRIKIIKLVAVKAFSVT